MKHIDERSDKTQSSWNFKHTDEPQNGQKLKWRPNQHGVAESHKTRQNWLKARRKQV